MPQNGFTILCTIQIKFYIFENFISFHLCLLVPVGPVVVSKSPPPLSEMERSFMEVKAGGRGRPADCVARHRVAIIIPFRDRPQHLQTLLYNLHPILLRQQIEYQIFVIEQEGKSTRDHCSFFCLPQMHFSYTKNRGFSYSSEILSYPLQIRIIFQSQIDNCSYMHINFTNFSTILILFHDLN